MITRVDATNYRCVERLGVPLSDFCVIAGANGSGKTTLLDIPVLLGDLLRGRNVAGAFMERLLGRGARGSAKTGSCIVRTHAHDTRPTLFPGGCFPAERSQLSL
jgi:recombinational DNA repair ATPase RecF